jgi:hypothetical protein
MLVPVLPAPVGDFVIGISPIGGYFFNAVGADFGVSVGAWSYGNVYPFGNPIVLMCQFTTQDGYTPVDPVVVALYVGSPNGAVTTYTYALNQVQKVSVGLYLMAFVPGLPGNWVYTWQGSAASDTPATGSPIEVTTRDYAFQVMQSAVTPGGQASSS